MLRNLFFFAMIAFAVLAAGCSQNRQPDEQDITRAMKAVWEKPGSADQPLSTIKINTISIGTLHGSNKQLKLKRFPKEMLMANAVIDFTQTTHYIKVSSSVHRITNAWIIKQPDGGWSIVNRGTVTVRD